VVLVRRIDAGHAVSIGPSSARCTGAALRAPGTIASTVAALTQPDRAASPQPVSERALVVGAREAVISGLRRSGATPGDEQQAVAVGLDAATFQHEPPVAVQAIGARRLQARQA
jgi:hypothetical protein